MRLKLVLILVGIVSWLVFKGSSDICNGYNINVPPSKKWQVVAIVSAIITLSSFIFVIIPL